jgi:hypothetical protein
VTYSVPSATSDTPENATQGGTPRDPSLNPKQSSIQDGSAGFSRAAASISSRSAADLLVGGGRHAEDATGDTSAGAMASRFRSNMASRQRPGRPLYVLGSRKEERASRTAILSTPRAILTVRKDKWPLLC